MRNLLLLFLAILPVAPLTGATIPIQHGFTARQGEARPVRGVVRSPGWMFMDLSKPDPLMTRAGGILTPVETGWAGSETAGQEFVRSWTWSTGARPDLRYFFSATLGTIRPLVQHQKLDLNRFNLDSGR